MITPAQAASGKTDSVDGPSGSGTHAVRRPVYTGDSNMPLIIASPAFADGAPIPSLYTCEGEDRSPPLEWRGVAEGAQSLVLIVDDPDAPDPRAPRMTWVHWVVYNIPPDTPGFPAAVIAGKLPAGTLEGLNDWKRTGYGGPCPPVGRHRYFHKLYALDTTLAPARKPTKHDIEEAMRGHVIGEAVLVGTYQKSR